MAEGHRERMRKRFYNEGLSNFEPHEALEVLLYFPILRKDTREKARTLIEKFGSFHAVLEAPREELIKFGLTENTAAFLNMLPEFANYYTNSRANGTLYFPDCTTIGNFLVNSIGERANEVFAVLCLSTQRKFINFEIINDGSVSATAVPIRKVVECAIRNNASKVVFAHNHPGGSLSPSPDDIKVTKKLVETFDAINIGVIDHIIVADGRFSSMSEQGRM